MTEHTPDSNTAIALPAESNALPQTLHASHESQPRNADFPVGPPVAGWKTGATGSHGSRRGPESDGPASQPAPPPHVVGYDSGIHSASIGVKNSQPEVLPPATMRQTEPLVVRVVSSFDQCPVSPQAWDEAVARLGGPIYMTFDWLKTWWEFYGRGRDLHLFIFSVDHKIVGLLPIYLDRLGIWPLHLKVGRLVGANVPPKVFDPPLDRDWAAPCLERALRLLIEKESTDVLSLGPVSSTCPSWQKVSAAANRLGGLIHCSQNSSGVYTVFRLPSEMQEYLKSLSKNEQKNRRKYELRTLQKEHAVRVDVIGDANADLCSEFDRFAVQHTQQWQAEGKSGHFGAWPDGLAYNRALVQNQGRLGRVRFVRVWAGDQVVANQYIFAFAGRWWWELPSRLVGEKWERFSLGPSGLVTMIGEAIKEGVCQLEGGLGHYEYKLRLKADEYPVHLFRVLACRPGTRFRYLLFVALRWLLERAYHKLWYRRTQPRLPARLRSPQWWAWLRLDF